LLFQIGGAAVKAGLRVGLAYIVVALAASSSAQSTISLGSFDGKVNSKAFATVPAAPIRPGKAPANFVIGSGTNQVWSLEDHEFIVGDRTLRYPIVGIVSGPQSDSSRNFTVFASTTTFAADLAAGTVLHSDGYVIETKRAIKAGDKVPTLLLVSGEFSIFSMEGETGKEEASGDTKSQPWLTIFKEGYKPANQTFAIDTWRITNGYVSTLALMRGMR
jgi:hypothetical protein